MNTTTVYKHSENNVAVAIGLKRTEDELNRMLVEQVIMPPEVAKTSQMLAKVIEICESPEEVAYMAFKLGHFIALVEAHEKRREKSSLVQKFINAF